MANKKITKNDIISTDIVYVIFTIVVALCFIAIAVVCALVLACCAIYLVKGFSTANPALAIGIDLLMLACVALFIWLDIVIFKTTKACILKYLAERKILLSTLSKDNSQN